MLTCNLLLAICLLQASQPRSVPTDSARSRSDCRPSATPYFLAANRISLEETYEAVAKEWLPNPQQAPITTTSPTLALEHSAAGRDATDFLSRIPTPSLLDQRTGQQHFPVARKFPFAVSRAAIVSPRPLNTKPRKWRTLYPRISAQQKSAIRNRRAL